MFYDNYVYNCNKVNRSPSAVATELGLSRACVNGWKNGKQPTDANRQKLAAYFGITVEALMSELPVAPAAPLVNRDAELTEYLEQLKSRKELRMLFSLASGATKADVEKAVKIIETLLDKDE